MVRASLGSYVGKPSSAYGWSGGFFLRVLWFSPTFDERSARYKWNILERAVKPKSKKKKKKKKNDSVDPDQLAATVCKGMGISGFSRTRVNQFTFIHVILLLRKPLVKKPAPVIDSDSDKGDAPRDLSNISEDDWLKITGQKTDTLPSQSTETTENTQESDSGSKPSKFTYFSPVAIIVIITRFFINVQVQGQHPHQWAPFLVADLLHAWQISHQISRCVYHKGRELRASTLCDPSLSGSSMSSWAYSFMPMPILKYEGILSIKYSFIHMWAKKCLPAYADSQGPDQPVHQNHWILQNVWRESKGLDNTLHICGIIWICTCCACSKLFWLTWPVCTYLCLYSQRPKVIPQKYFLIDFNAF